MDWLTFWPDDSETLTSWQDDVSNCLGGVSESHVKRVSLGLPSQEDARLAWRDNVDLHGTISFETDKGPIGPFEIALPFSGVFIKRGNKGDVPNAYTWSSWLAELPGVRRVWSMTDDIQKLTASVRIGLLDGRYIELPCVKKSDAEENRQLNKIRDMIDEVRLLLACAKTSEAQKLYPKWVIDALSGVVNVVDSPGIKKNSKTVQDALVKFAVQVRENADGLPICDRDDLQHRMLVTFPVWLRYRILRRFLYLKTTKSASPINEVLSLLADGLVPVGGGRRGGAFELVRPDNIIELAARVSGVRRYGSSARVTGLLPAHFRQNHPSFEGRICPIETPESGMVGIALHLARGAKVDGAGQIVPAEKDDGDGCLPCVSWCTSLIPFFHHNDDARNMMGAKNIRQAMRVSGAESPLVRSGGEDGLVKRFLPLSEIGVSPCCTDEENNLVLGRNLLVAYLPWNGWNVDDAVVISESLRDKMAVAESKRYSEFVDPDWHLVELHSDDPKDGGNLLRCGDTIAVFEGPNGERRRFRYVDSDEATLEKVVFPDDNQRVEGFVYRFEYVIKKTFRLGPGDKLMGRHGNKGVVSKVLPDNEMPHVFVPSEDKKLPIDILLNPHGVLSRMNPGQLLETHLGWLFKNGVAEAAVKTDNQFPAGYPQRGLIDHDKVRRLLGENGLDDHGRARLWFWDQEDPEDKAVVVGYQYFFRLHHIPQLKAQARRGGAGARYSYKTGQATQGRLRGGGQRVGEMEFWALQAYPGTVPIIREMLSSKSDAVALRTRNNNLLPVTTGFEEVLHDWFKAMMIKMERKGDQVTFSRLSSDEVRCKNGDVLALAKAEKAVAKYHCPKGSGYEFLDGRRLPLSLGESEMGEILEDDSCCAEIKKKLTLGDLLRAFNKKCERPIEYDCDKKCYWLFFDDVSSADTGRLKLELIDYRRDGSSLAFKLTVLENEILPGWPKDLRSFTCYGRWQTNGKLLHADVLLNELLGKGDGKTVHSANAYSVLCPCPKCGGGSPHPNKVLQSVDVGIDRSAIDPLHAPKMFGEVKDAFCPADEEKWGYIELPFKIAYPIEDVFGKGVDDKVLSNFLLDAIPVLPLRYRMSDPRSRGRDLVSDAYQALLAFCMEQPVESEASCKELSGLLAWLFSCILNEIGGRAPLLARKGVREKGKRALIRREGLGRRVDRSCRMVVTPNPELAMDEVGVPATILWELMDGDTLFGARRQKAPKEQVDDSVGFAWRPAGEIQTEIDPEKRWEKLNEFFRKESRWMLLNRQPSLHKYSFQSFRVKPMRPDEGDVFQLPPTCCKGFGADFDGDEMAGHYPVTEEAQKASENLSPSKNILSDGDGSPLVSFDRDFVMGVSLLYPKRTDPETIISEICNKPDAFERLCKISKGAYRKCTEERVSFGFYDLLDLQRNDAEEEWKARFEEVLKEEGEGRGRNARFVARMVLSGANGKKQIHQLVDARGKLSPGTLGFVLSEDQKKRLDIQNTLVGGMTWDEVFWSSMNARASMCDKKLNTGLAGDLTRRLVFALQDIESDGVKTGLIAAQSIGERGSQLSMKSAHEGQRAVDIEMARKVILSGEDANGNMISTYEQFKQALCGDSEESATPYARLKEEHLRLLWSRLEHVDDRKLSRKASVHESLKTLEGLDLLAQGGCLSFARNILTQSEKVNCEIGQSIFAKVMFNAFN